MRFRAYEIRPTRLMGFIAQTKPILLLLREYVISVSSVLCPFSSTKINLYQNYKPQSQYKFNMKLKSITASTSTPLFYPDSRLQREIITRGNPFSPIRLPYGPPLTRNVAAHLQYFAFCKTNLIRIFDICFVCINRFRTIRIRRRFFNHTVHSGRRFSGIGIASGS